MKNRLFAVPALLVLVLSGFMASEAMAETAGKVRLTSGAEKPSPSSMTLRLPVTSSPCCPLN